MFKKKKRQKTREKPPVKQEKKISQAEVQKEVVPEQKADLKKEPVKKVKVKKKDPIQKPKKQKKVPEEYVFKHTTFLQGVRIVFWIMIAFIFIKGVQACLRPDQVAEVDKTISEFKQEFSDYKDTDTEVMSFAQNFVREYMTYKNNGEEEYKKRITPYVSDRVLYTSDLTDFNGEAEVTYSRAYRKEEYSENQIDVYVLAEVEYRVQELSEDGETFKTKKTENEILLKVPIFREKGRYIVEGIPCFVNDDIKVEDFGTADYVGTEITNDLVKSEILNSLTNFFTAYYSQEQSVINYFLTKEAVQDKFVGLNGRIIFDSITSLKCYQEEMQKDIICIVKLKVRDSMNDVSMMQEFNVILVKEAEKYYVKDINTKTANLNIKNEVQTQEQE